MHAFFSLTFFKINMKQKDSPTGPVAIWRYCCTSWKIHCHFIIVGYFKDCSDLCFISRMFSSPLRFANLLQHHSSTEYVLSGFILWISSNLEGHSISWRVIVLTIASENGQSSLPPAPQEKKKKQQNSSKTCPDIKSCIVAPDSNLAIQLKQSYIK